MTKYPAHFYERLYALLDALEKAAREVTDAEWAEACQRADYPIAGRDESRALLDALNSVRLKG